MIIKLQIILAIIILFYGCKQQHSQEEKPYIVDNLRKVNLRLDIDSMTNSSSTIEAYFDIEKDSIHVLQSEELCKHIDSLFLLYFINEYVEKKLALPESPPPPPPMETTDRLRTQKEDISGKLKVIISQTHIVTKNHQMIGEDSILFQAYPVLVKNMTDSLLTLECEGARLFMVQQAKDEQGVWRELEYWRGNKEIPFCDSGIQSIAILANCGLMSKTPVFRGDFNTEIRIKFFSEGKIYYSNSIQGQVNKGQLMIPQELLRKKDFEPREYLLSEKKKNET
ncbi:hypothetical protein GXP67_01540 [Rhodocytophaga rosea]|uniref:Uncharacterized protein n=1 Tax=Rhodocytophaga rosea TaxID=2704465 RepID=A0A6C0GBU4_9BACT|nr:hypothetical protein [Rhodocytophaga rosea]QHT65449.1 hypothetical protein GXP67_01540 [Rhodocytophaga rosea]